MTREKLTIQSLRSDIAMQIARMARRSGATQLAAASRLGIPQPTLSKIMHGRVHDLSIEFLLRVAVRAGLALTLQTGRDAKEAGAYVSMPIRKLAYPSSSKLAMQARKLLETSERRLSATERLEAFLQHNQLVNAFHKAGRAAEQKRASVPAASG